MQGIHKFTGLEIMPFCTTHRCTAVWIDRVRVAAVRTVYGEIHFFVEGSHGCVNEWFPLSRQYTEPGVALDMAEVLMKRIRAARQIEQERREKDKRR